MYILLVEKEKSGNNQIKHRSSENRDYLGDNFSRVFISYGYVRHQLMKKRTGM
jgi:hypothetical protein